MMTKRFCRKRDLLVLLALFAVTVSYPAFAEQNAYAAEKKRSVTPLVEAGTFKFLYDPTTDQSNPWALNDHTIIFGSDRKWHLFAITHPVPLNWYKDPGKNLLHATATNLTQSPWHAEPFAVSADWDRFGEFLFWAPHVISYKKVYYMFVCAGNKQGHQYKIHLLTSKDLWHWERSPANPLLVDGYDGRDPNVLRVGNQWHLYYTATSRPEGGHHIVACVTSKDLRHWSERRVVFTHPQEGTFGGPTESPFIVQRGNSFYLFACDSGTINVYLSKDPFHWDPTGQVGTIDAHASEVVRDLDGKWYVTHAGWEHGGLSIAPLIWHDSLDRAPSSLKAGGRE